MNLKKVIAAFLGTAALTAAVGVCAAEPRWRVQDTVYESEELLTVGYNVLEFGAVGDGVTDDTQAFQQAIDAAAEAGGASVFIPAGHYAIKGNLVLKQGAVLQGDMKKPERTGKIEGTVLMAYAGRNNEKLKPFITMDSYTGVKDLAIWYPEQTADNIVAYPPTIQQGDERLGGVNYCLIENVEFVNSYIGYKKSEKFFGACFVIRDVCGTPLKLGIDIDAIADVGRVERADFSPQYWENSGLANAPKPSGKHREWLYEHAIAVSMKRNDWSYGRFLSAEGYNVGFYTLNTMSTVEGIGPDGVRIADHYPNGENYGLSYSGCKTGIVLENTANAGVIFTDVEIKNCENGIHLPKQFTSKTQILDARINAERYALLNESSGGRLMLEACEFNGGAVELSSGYTSVTDSDFNNPLPQLSISGGANAVVKGNRFSQGENAVSNTGNGEVLIDGTPTEAARVFRFPRIETEEKKPSKSDLFIVSDYGAVGDGETDDTQAFVKAFNAAEENGGGIMFVPPGRYKITDNLTLPENTELRGAVDIPRWPVVNESVIEVYCGKGDASAEPFLKLSPKSIVRGLSFDYPEQSYSEPYEYPYLMQGLGNDVSVINVGVRQTCYALDLFTYKCDNAYVNAICGQAWKNLVRVGGGSRNVQLYNTQSNLGSVVNGHNMGWTWNSPVRDGAFSENSNKINKYLKENFNSFIFGDTKELLFYDNFIIPGGVGLTLMEENGSAPSGKALGYASDDSRIAFAIDAVDESGFDFINTQLVGVSNYGLVPSAIQTSENYTGTMKLFGGAFWGNMDKFVDMNGSGTVEIHAANFASQLNRPFVVNRGTLKVVNSKINTYFDTFIETGSDAKNIFICNNYETGENAKKINTDGAFAVWDGNADTTNMKFTEVEKTKLTHALPSESFIVRLGNVAIAFDEQPAIQNEEGFLVPVRNIFERLYFDVAWDDEAKSITADDGERKIEFAINSDIVRINGETVRISEKPCIIGEKTMVSDEFIKTVIGSQTSWDDYNRIYTIDVPKMKDTAADSSNPVVPLKIYSSSATTEQSGNENDHAYDGDPSTRWAAEGEQSITFDLGAKRLISSADMIFYNGHERSYRFTIEVSEDGESFEKIFDGQSAGNSNTEPERFEFDEVMARYVRYNGNGCETASGHNAWNNINEIVINGRK